MHAKVTISCNLFDRNFRSHDCPPQRYITRLANLHCSWRRVASPPKKVDHTALTTTFWLCYRRKITASVYLDSQIIFHSLLSSILS